MNKVINLTITNALQKTQAQKNFNSASGCEIAVYNTLLYSAILCFIFLFKYFGLIFFTWWYE
jgi:hypothetical protein